MDSHTPGGSAMSRHRWLRRCLVAGTTVLMVTSGGSAAFAQPTTTVPAAPTTTTLSTAPDLAPTDRPVETSADPCLAPTTTPSSTATATTTLPSVPCATTPPVPEPVPTISATAAAPQPAQAPAVPTEVSTQTSESGPAEVPPISKVPYTAGPTENPKATIVPGQMRSDRQEIPEPFTKADADLAETLEAQAQASRSAFAPMACQYFWPSPYMVCGAILDKYLSLGAENSFLKHPINVELSNPDGIGSRQEFLVGPIYAHPTAGAHPVVNSFMTKWGSFGWEASFLGYPTTDEIVNPDGIGRRQHFQNADIYWHPVASPGANVIGGAIRDKWNTVGAENIGSLLGYPLTDEIWNSDTVGRRQGFERGAIYWSPSTGAYPLTGVVLYGWIASGMETGTYGYPIEDKVVETLRESQQFQNGEIVVSLTEDTAYGERYYDCNLDTEYPHVSGHRPWTVDAVTKGECDDPKREVWAMTTLVGPVECVRGHVMGCAQPAHFEIRKVGDGVTPQIQPELKFATALDCVPGEYYTMTDWKITNDNGGVLEIGTLYGEAKEVGYGSRQCQPKPEGE